MEKKQYLIKIIKGCTKICCFFFCWILWAFQKSFTRPADHSSKVGENWKYMEKNHLTLSAELLSHLSLEQGSNLQPWDSWPCDHKGPSQNISWIPTKNLLLTIQTLAHTYIVGARVGIIVDCYFCQLPKTHSYSSFKIIFIITNPYHSLFVPALKWHGPSWLDTTWNMHGLTDQSFMAVKICQHLSFSNNRIKWPLTLPAYCQDSVLKNSTF